MASFSCGSSGSRTCHGDGDGVRNGGGGGLFVGSFNINSEDLTGEAARAWLKQAKDADIVALGLQECGVVPANPFPDPTNGKAVAMWENIKGLTMPNAVRAAQNVSQPAGGGGKNCPRLAGIAQAAITAALEAAELGGGTGGSAAAGGERDGTTEEDVSEASLEANDATMPVDSPRLLGGGRRAPGKHMRQESYYLRGVVEADRDKKLLSTIADCIPGRHLVADVAMGETPTHGKIKVSLSPTPSAESSLDSATDPLEGGQGSSLDVSARSNWSVSEGKSFKTVEWYGTIRLLVFVREGMFKDLNVRTVVIPSGDKPSVVADAPEDYAKDTSPDKGAVACYLKDPSTQLEVLLVNCHLYGTNKYGVPEAVFDKYRMAQLRAIDSALRASLPSTAPAQMVLFGDLNFRVEMLSGADDKEKGGNDFRAVIEMAEAGDLNNLRELYNNADRLRPLLEGERGGIASPQEDRSGANSSREGDQHNSQVPSLLAGLQDGLGESLARGRAIRPTFTYKPGDSSCFPRRFNDKRTPSWTDRILWRGFAEDQECRGIDSMFASVVEVIGSDHEPVYCLLSLPRKTPS